MIKTLLSTLTLGVAALSFGVAAHGDSKPTHGGVVQSGNDLNFELVLQADGAAIYIVDHEKPMSTAGVSGKLTVLNGTEKSEAPLLPAGDKLESKGVKLVSGCKVLASIVTADKKTTIVRFAVK
ncbi:MAG: hypothetical protein K2Q07_08370 [Burkholderiaceae bacterium]|nr:hypothetical protein [Burkholderiaceae bacterium]